MMHLTLRHALGVFWMVSTALALSACGGSSAGSTASTARIGESASSEGGPSGQGSPDAALTTQSLAQAEAESLQSDPSVPLENVPAGLIAAKPAHVSGEVARKALAARIPVYRFYNVQTGVHFYTTSEAEKNSIIANLAGTYSYEGPAYYVLAADWKA